MKKPKRRKEPLVQPRGDAYDKPQPPPRPKKKG